MNSFQNLVTDEQLHDLKELSTLAKGIKNKWFSMGRDWDRFVKLTDKIWGIQNENPQKKEVQIKGN